MITKIIAVIVAGLMLIAGEYTDENGDRLILLEAANEVEVMAAAEPVAEEAAGLAEDLLQDVGGSSGSTDAVSEDADMAEGNGAPGTGDEQSQVSVPAMHLYGNCRITFYCPCSRCCGAWAGGATASGVMPTAGHTVATGSLPFGTRLIIGGQEYVVEDRGVGDFQVDIFVNSHDEALARGLYYEDVYIIDG